jgi:phage terminase large subunit
VKIQTTKHFEQLENSNKRISVHQGGTRSGKTFNILIWLVITLLRSENKVVTICRKTLPALKGTAYRDFLSILDMMELYNIANHNKTELTYNIGSNLVEFISLDQPQKVRGRKRDMLFINEANEITQEDWRQLTMRTNCKAILDYNPSDEFHFIYDEILTRDDCDFTRTTYLDNPFLSKAIVREIERYKEVDPNYWRVYGLGERGASEATIFKNFELTNRYDDIDAKEVCGLDFGYNDPVALVAIKKIDKEVPEIYAKELLYKTRMTSSEIVDAIKENVKNKSIEIMGDGSRPEIIEDIRRAGINSIKEADRGKNSVKDSINYLKKYKLFIDKFSLNLIKEMRMYKWRVQPDGRMLDDPVDLNNHAIDALRYAAYRRVRKFNFYA